jgi:hypothetical protein
MYLLVDGAVQEAGPADGDFDAWEKQWIQQRAAEQPPQESAPPNSP